MLENKKISFEKQSIKKRIKSMLVVDFRRMFTMPLVYIMIGVSLVIPILILVMTTMMGQSTEQPGMEGFTNVWQAIGSVSSNSQTMTMDLTSMFNINLIYFIIAILVCIFVSDDFRSGYSKNLFTVRSDKKDYVISKTLVCFVAGATMIISYFIGALLGGAIAGLSFELGDVSAMNITMCMLSKIFLVALFVSIYLIMSVVGKQRLWLSILASLGVSMLLFNIVPIVSPLDCGLINVILSIAGAAMFSLGIGVGTNQILRKTALV